MGLCHGEKFVWRETALRRHPRALVSLITHSLYLCFLSRLFHTRHENDGTRGQGCRANENERICREANFTLEARNHYDIPHLYFNQFFETKTGCLHKKHCLFRFCKKKGVFLWFSARICSYANLQLKLLGLEIPYLLQKLLNISKLLSIIRKGK